MAKKASVSKSSVSSSKRYESSMEEFFIKKMPSLPAGMREAVVNIAPWLVLLSIVMMIRPVFAFGRMMAPYGYMMSYGLGMGYVISWIATVIVFILDIMALKGLFAKKMYAWRLMFYSVGVSAIGSLLSGSLLSAIVGAGMGLYVLYQVRSYYK